MNAYVIYNATQNDSNLIYWGHFEAPDPFLAIKLGEHKVAFISELEYGRCKATSRFDEVLLFTEIREQAQQKYNKLNVWAALFCFLKDRYSIDGFIIPDNFPAKIYAEIKSFVEVNFDRSFFETQRALKTADEIEEIKKACSLTAETIDYARDILRQSDVRNGELYWEQQPLTSNRLRAMMEVYCLLHGGYADSTIIACRQEASDPHCLGSKVLLANQFIVVDFFPRLQKSHYYGDMTRTFIKGNVSQEQAKMYACVYQCQQALIGKIHPGVKTSELMQFALDFFDKAGYGLRKSESGYEGFIHSVGHGLGLDIHEYPSLGHRPTILEAGMVVTVEPGLYFKDRGGVRIEDDVLVTSEGARVLSHCDYELEV